MLPTVETTVIKILIEINQCQIIVAMSSQLGINRETIRISLKKMGQKSKAGIWGPHELSDYQKSVFQYAKCSFPNKKMKTSLIVS